MELNFSESRPYHYIISVALRNMNSKNPGEMYLKHFLEFTNDDIIKVRDAVRLTKDKLLTTTQNEALTITETSDLVHGIAAMKLAAQANNASLHHFSSATPWSAEDMEKFVEMCNKSKELKEKLLQAKIR